MVKLQRLDAVGEDLSGLADTDEHKVREYLHRPYTLPLEVDLTKYLRTGYQAVCSGLKALFIGFSDLAVRSKFG